MPYLAVSFNLDDHYDKQFIILMRTGNECREKLYLHESEQLFCYIHILTLRLETEVLSLY